MHLFVSLAVEPHICYRVFLRNTRSNHHSSAAVNPPGPPIRFETSPTNMRVVSSSRPQPLPSGPFQLTNKL